MVNEQKIEKLEWFGLEIVRISSVPNKEKFTEWLRGQTLPLVPESDEPYGWAYAWDYERFVKGLNVVD